MKKYICILLYTLPFLSIVAQETQPLKLSGKQIETLFLKQNLQLIAEKMNIDIADAEIVQARLWENPELSISGVNLWSTKTQREEVYMNSFPKNTQLSIELSQLIQTANKRGKLISRDKVAKEIVIQEFEDILRGLKVELRKSIFELQYRQSYLSVLKSQEQVQENLIAAYQKQMELGNIAKNELLRLQSASLELDNEINELETEINEQQRVLKSLLNCDPLTEIEIDDENKIFVNPHNISLTTLLQQASDQRPDIKKLYTQTLYYEKSLVYEKSQRIPDITLSASYDKYGGVWKDFIGFGISFNLPFFNRNQGAVKAARIGREQSQYLAQSQQNIAQYEVVEAYNNYQKIYKLYTKTSNNPILSELDGMMNLYVKNLLNRNISILEYLDFVETYKNNKQSLLNYKRNIQIQFEELQYVSASEIK